MQRKQITTFTRAGVQPNKHHRREGDKKVKFMREWF